MTFVEYNELLQLITLKDPAHPALPMLRRGKTAINAMLIKSIAAKLPLDKPETIRVETPEEKFEKLTSTDNIYRSLNIQRNKFYQERRELSNSFHDTKTVAQRASISTNIQYIQDKIEGLNKKIRAYENGGVLIAEEQSKETALDQLDAIQLKNKQLSVRSNLSRERSHLRNAYNLPEGPKRDKLINKSNERIRQLEIEELGVTKKINDAKRS